MHVLRNFRVFLGPAYSESISQGPRNMYNSNNNNNNYDNVYGAIVVTKVTARVHPTRWWVSRLDESIVQGVPRGGRSLQYTNALLDWKCWKRNLKNLSQTLSLSFLVLSLTRKDEHLTDYRLAVIHDAGPKIVYIEPNQMQLGSCPKIRPNPTQPSPTDGWTQPMSIYALHTIYTVCLRPVSITFIWWM